MFLLDLVIQLSGLVVDSIIELSSGGVISSDGARISLSAPEITHISRASIQALFSFSRLHSLPRQGDITSEPNGKSVGNPLILCRNIPTRLNMDSGQVKLGRSDRGKELD